MEPYVDYCALCCCFYSLHVMVLLVRLLVTATRDLPCDLVFKNLRGQTDNVSSFAQPPCLKFMTSHSVDSKLR